MNNGTIYSSDYREFNEAYSIRTKIFQYRERDIYDWKSGDTMVVLPIQNISSMSIQHLEYRDKGLENDYSDDASKPHLISESYLDTIHILEGV
jgi:hypothetical protein